MITKHIAAVLVTTALMTGVASAQTTTTTKADTNATPMMHKEGEWRASKLVGVNVYNEANEKIGNINEVILDRARWQNRTSSAWASIMSRSLSTN